MLYPLSITVILQACQHVKLTELGSKALPTTELTSVSFLLVFLTQILQPLPHPQASNSFISINAAQSSEGASVRQAHLCIVYFQLLTPWHLACINIGRSLYAAWDVQARRNRIWLQFPVLLPVRSQAYFRATMLPMRCLRPATCFNELVIMVAKNVRARILAFGL